jgi:imidazolonepropionase-like amidohydrolase
LHQATGAYGDLLALSGRRNPYPKKLGVIEPGAYADLLLVNGNPLEDITLLGTPDKSLAVIVKNGEVVKNILAK